ncbi:MAG: prepilin-type N-terminal cleavage/methylation domain-containing protein [Anaerolineaceae bacterium]|nr:prepilin-type N-terminal cleavage/methylation domain-containing protein [Anaerolineaceae bacterium]
MAGRFGSAEGRCGFTLVELLIVISVIMILAAILVLTWPAVEERIVKVHCQTNLYKCQKILAEYGANNYGYLPPMSGSNHMGVIEYPSSERNYVVEELKSYGASAEVFTCPASPIYGDENSYKWYCWTAADDREIDPTWVYTSARLFCAGGRKG